MPRTTGHRGTARPVTSAPRAAAILFVLQLLLSLAAATASAQPRDDLIGRLAVHTIAAEDTLVDLAVQYEVGFVEMAAANPGIDPWLPRPGTNILIPSAHLLPTVPRRGIVINLADQRLYFFPARGEAQSYPIGVASDGVTITVGTARVIRKRVNPVWVPPPSVRAEMPDLPESVPPGPDNPLGAFALDLSWTSTAIHGTNSPYGVGRRVSHGCFRLYPTGIEKLFPQVAIGTEVRVVNQPVKMGWSGGKLLLEVHPTLEQADQIEAQGRSEPVDLPDLQMTLMDFAGAIADEIDWGAVHRIAREHRGLPVPVLKPSMTAR